MDLIELKELNKSYGAVQALNGLSLSVPKGSFFGLLGPNGAGKSTALRIICTLIIADSGQVRVAGKDASENPSAIRKELGYVAQEVALDKILTGRELLNFQGDLYHLNRDYRDFKISELIERLDMSSWIDRRSGTYSGGMKRRLDLASGLLHQPTLLVLDEPTVGLDIESRTIVWDFLRELRAEGTTILLSSHYLEEVDALVDDMAIIDHGQVIAEGTPEQLKKRLGGDRATLRVREFSNQQESEQIKILLKELNGVNEVIINRSQGFSLNLVIDDQNVLATVRQKLVESKYDVFSLSHSRPTLDDVYLQATGRSLMDAELELAGKRDLKLESKQSMR